MWRACQKGYHAAKSCSFCKGDVRAATSESGKRALMPGRGVSRVLRINNDALRCQRHARRGRLVKQDLTSLKDAGSWDLWAIAKFGRKCSHFESPPLCLSFLAFLAREPSAGPHTRRAAASGLARSLDRSSWIGGSSAALAAPLRAKAAFAITSGAKAKHTRRAAGRLCRSANLGAIITLASPPAQDSKAGPSPALICAGHLPISCR